MQHRLVLKAFNELYPDKEFRFTSSIRYSGKFADYNANVRQYDNHLDFRLSKKWRNISEEIVMGLLQELILKIISKKKKSTYIDLYNTFVKKLHLAIPKTKSHPVLEDSFDRINEKYFYGTIERPNLIWGKHSTTQVGLYDFKRDTITISSILRNAEQEILDYVMYHELLHKKTKFKSGNGRTLYHSKEFKNAERRFEGYEFMEKKLQKHISREKRPGFLKSIRNL